MCCDVGYVLLSFSYTFFLQDVLEYGISETLMHSVWKIDIQRILNLNEIRLLKTLKDAYT